MTKAIIRNLDKVKSLPEFIQELKRLGPTEKAEYYDTTDNLNRVLLSAVAQGEMDIIRVLFLSYQNKINIYSKNAIYTKNTKNYTFLQFLCMCAWSVPAKAIENLSLNACKLNHQDDEGNTALHSAVIYNQIPLIIKLLEKNPELVLIKNHQGYTPLDFAAINNIELFDKIISICQPTKEDNFKMVYTIPRNAIIQAKQYARMTSPSPKATIISTGQQRHAFYLRKIEAINTIQNLPKENWQYQLYQAVEGKQESGEAKSWWQRISHNIQNALFSPALTREKKELQVDDKHFKTKLTNIEELEAKKLQQHSKTAILEDLKQLLVALPTKEVLEFLTNPKVESTEPFNPRVMTLVLNELLARVQHQPIGLAESDVEDKPFSSQINKFSVTDFASLQQFCALTIKTLATQLSTAKVSSDELFAVVLKLLQQKADILPATTSIKRMIIRQLNTFTVMIDQLCMKITGKSQLSSSLVKEDKLIESRIHPSPPASMLAETGVFAESLRKDTGQNSEVKITNLHLSTTPSPS